MHITFTRWILHIWCNYSSKQWKRAKLLLASSLCLYSSNKIPVLSHLFLHADWTTIQDNYSLWGPSLIPAPGLVLGSVGEEGCQEICNAPEVGSPFQKIIPNKGKIRSFKHCILYYRISKKKEELWSSDHFQRWGRLMGGSGTCLSSDGRKNSIKWIGERSFQT